MMMPAKMLADLIPLEGAPKILDVWPVTDLGEWRLRKNIRARNSWRWTGRRCWN